MGDSRAREVGPGPGGCRCANCGGPATIYPYPEPKGSCVCRFCMPVWYRAFIKQAAADSRALACKRRGDLD